MAKLTDQGLWSAASNDPALSDATGTEGWIYTASDAGTVDFGSGDIDFLEGDSVVFTGLVWVKQPGDIVQTAAANYSSIAEWAAKTEEDWTSELLATQTALWGADGVLGALFEGLAQGKPFVAALIEAIIHNVFGVGDLFDTVSEALSALAENFSTKWEALAGIVEWVGDAVAQLVTTIGDLLGIDLSDWQTAVANVLAWWTAAFGDVNIFADGFDPATLFGGILTNLVSKISDLLSIDLSGWQTNVANLLALWGGALGDVNIFDGLTTPADLVGAVLDAVIAAAGTLLNIDLSAWQTNIANVLAWWTTAFGDTNLWTGTFSLGDVASGLFGSLLDWVGTQLGIDLSGWQTAISNMLAAWTAAFGDTNLFGGSFSLGDVASALFGALLTWVSDQLGIDLSGWSTAIANLLAWWTDLWGDLNIFDGLFDPLELLSDLFDKLVEIVGTVLGIDLSGWSTAIANLLGWWTDFWGDLNIFSGDFAPLELVSALFDKIVGVVGTVIGIDLSGWSTAIENFMTFWTSLFGDANVFDGSGVGWETLITGFLTVANIPTFPNLFEWVRENLLTPLTVAFTGDPNSEGGFVAIANAIRNLLTTTSQIPAQNIIGKLSDALLGVIPVGNVANISPNLIAQGEFVAQTSVVAGGGWEHDAATNYTGSTGGSAKATASAANLYLYSVQYIPVHEGDVLRVSCQVKTDSYAGSGSPVSLSFVEFNGQTEGSTVVVDSTGSTSGSWVELTDDDYTVGSGVNAIIVRLGVGSTMTSGSVWFDSVSVKKVGLLQQGLVNELLDYWDNLGDGLKGTSGGNYQSLTEILSAAAYTLTRANTGITNASTAQSTANTANSTANTANSTANTNSTNVQDTWNKLVQAYSGGSETGQTAAQAKTAVANIKTVGTNAQSTANTGVTNAATAQTTANTANTNLQTTWNNVYDGLNGTSGSTGKTSANVQTVAGTVRTTANTGVANAATAQGTANTAVTNASTAQSTANTASSNTTSIANNVYNAWFGSGGSGSMAHLTTVVSGISSTFLGGYTIHWLSTPGTSTWYRTSTGLSGGTAFGTADILEFWVICIGSGGGGGAGLGSSGGGGSPGQPGKYFAIQIEPANVPASASYTVAAGPAGRAAGSGDTTPTSGSDSTFGSLASSAWALTTAIASPIGYIAADDSRPGEGGTGGATGPTGVAGTSTPLSNGGAAGAANGNGGYAGQAVNFAGTRRGCGAGGGGGAAGHPTGYGGSGGTGGAPGGGGGGGGGSALASNTYGGPGGTGGNGVVLVFYKLKQG